jgi:hypothetical protein
MSGVAGSSSAGSSVESDMAATVVNDFKTRRVQPPPRIVDDEPLEGQSGAKRQRVDDNGTREAFIRKLTTIAVEHKLMAEGVELDVLTIEKTVDHLTKKVTDITNDCNWWKHKCKASEKKNQALQAQADANVAAPQVVADHNACTAQLAAKQLELNNAIAAHAVVIGTHGIELVALKERIRELEEENKKLKEQPNDVLAQVEAKATQMINDRAAERDAALKGVEDAQAIAKAKENALVNFRAQNSALAVELALWKNSHGPGLCHLVNSIFDEVVPKQKLGEIEATLERITKENGRAHAKASQLLQALDMMARYANQFAVGVSIDAPWHDKLRRAVGILRALTEPMDMGALSADYLEADVPRASGISSMTKFTELETERKDLCKVLRYLDYLDNLNPVPVCTDKRLCILASDRAPFRATLDKAPLQAQGTGALGRLEALMRKTNISSLAESRKTDDACDRCGRPFDAPSPAPAPSSSFSSPARVLFGGSSAPFTPPPTAPKETYQGPHSGTRAMPAPGDSWSGSFGPSPTAPFVQPRDPNRVAYAPVTSDSFDVPSKRPGHVQRFVQLKTLGSYGVPVSYFSFTVTNPQIKDGEQIRLSQFGMFASKRYIQQPNGDRMPVANSAARFGDIHPPGLVCRLRAEGSTAISKDVSKELVPFLTHLKTNHPTFFDTEPMSYPIGGEGARISDFLDTFVPLWNTFVQSFYGQKGYRFDADAAAKEIANSAGLKKPRLILFMAHSIVAVNQGNPTDPDAYTFPPTPMLKMTEMSPLPEDKI